jgi:hypothetical protein
VHEDLLRTVPRRRADRRAHVAGRTAGAGPARSAGHCRPGRRRAV